MLKHEIPRGWEKVQWTGKTLPASGRSRFVVSKGKGTIHIRGCKIIKTFNPAGKVDSVPESLIRLLSKHQIPGGEVTFCRTCLWQHIEPWGRELFMKR